MIQRVVHWVIGFTVVLGVAAGTPQAGAAVVESSRATASPGLPDPGAVPGLDPTGLTAPLDDRDVSVEVCASTASGRRLACMQVHRDGDGNADGVTCVYDDALGIFGWGFQRELTCVETTEGWGFISGAGVCVRSLGLDRPQACVNGRDECLLWVMSVQVVCHEPE